MPLFVSPANLLHGEPLLLEGFIYLVANLETVEADARTYLYNNISWMSAIDSGHFLYSMFYDAFHR